MKPLKHKAIRVESFDIDGVSLIHEYDGFSNHRIRIDMGAGKSPLDGAWKNWRGMSKLEWKDRTYYGVTDYHISEFGASVFAVIKGEVT